MQDKYFQNKNILITGITGFVGSSLAKKLKILGANVYGFSKRAIGKNIVIIDTTDYSAVNRFIKNKNISICFHLAGKTLVEEGQKDPYDTFRINIEGALNLLESARKNKLEKIIIASTSHVYGSNKVPYLEKYLPRPSRPYETSKACVDLIARSYEETFDLKVFIPRFVNIYGPGDLHFVRLIPRTIKAILSNEILKMWGGEMIRDYLYIDDAVNAYIRLAKVNMTSIGNERIFNFGSNNLISVKDLIAKIINLSGKKIIIEKINKERTREIQFQYVSWEKAKNVLKWHPETNLDEGLKKTIDWYKKYF